jgi:hypothetical protein
MAGNDVTIQLRAQDGASNTFRQVGRSAQDMGRQIDQTGKTGEQSLTRISKAGAVAGAAFTALSGTLSLAARANAEAEASQARLSTAIENTGHSLFEYKDAIDAASKTALQLGFDDEDAADSIAKLTTATGDANKATKDLAIAEDISRARKIDLASATNIVIAAEQGRTGALKRIGIQIDENASKEQTLAALQQTFAGNAEAYSRTSAAGMDRLKNSAENALEAIGAHLGPMQELLMLAPGLHAGFVGLGTAVGALAPEFTAAAAAATLLDVALGPVGIAALAIGAAAALFEFSSTAKQDFVPSVDDANTSAVDLNQTLRDLIETGSVISPLAKETTDAFTSISSGVADYQARLSAAKKEAKDFSIIPSGEPGQVDEYTKHQQHAADALAALAAEADKASISNEDLSKAQTAINDILTSTAPAAADSRIELQKLTDQVHNGDILWSEYIDSVIGVDAIMDQLSLTTIKQTGATNDQTYATQQATHALDTYSAAQAAQLTTQTDAFKGLQDEIAAQDALNQKKAEYASFAGMQVQTGNLNDLIAQNAALKEQQGAYYGVADGIQSVGEAQAVFKQTQDGLIGSEGTYTGQLSEYQTQLGYINNAQDLLNQRVADGIPLTQEQTDFLNDAASAQERLTGGTEDATIQLGIQAEQYAENMRIGDELNQNTSNLNGTIQDLILALQGIPGYVRTELDADTSDLAAGVAGAQAMLDTIDGRTVTTYVNIEQGYVAPGALGYQLGGMTPANHALGHAQHGAAMNGGWWMVGEAGPELTNGRIVLPATASAEHVRSSGGGGGITMHFHKGVTVVADDPRHFADQMRSFQYGQMR